MSQRKIVLELELLSVQGDPVELEGGTISTITTTLDRYGYLMRTLGSQHAANLNEMPRRSLRMGPNVDHGDAEIVALSERYDETDDLPADSEGGQYWVRTSDPAW
jgi:hypothetical protein